MSCDFSIMRRPSSQTRRDPGIGACHRRRLVVFSHVYASFICHAQLYRRYRRPVYARLALRARPMPEAAMADIDVDLPPADGFYGATSNAQGARRL